MKKIISLFSVCAILSSFCFSVSAASEPTISLSATTTGYLKGDTVTVTCNYSGFDVTPYDDNVGEGQKITGAQVKINIPGGLGTAKNDKLFLRPGLTNTSAFSSGAPTWNPDMKTDTFSAVIINIEDSMQTEGKIFELSMKLNKDITEDLAFTFVDSFEQALFYDNYSEWTMGDPVQVKNAKLVPFTLKAPSTKADVTGVTIDNKADFTLDLNGNTTKKLTATVAPENATNKEVKWTSDNEKAATVSPDGVVTAVAVGTANITVTTVDGNFKDSVTVTVEDSTPVAPIISVESVGDMLVGNEITLNVSNDKDAALDYKFASSNEEVATVDEKGVVKAVGIGNAKITISAAGAESAELTVTVRAAGENDEVVLPGTDKKIKVFKMQNVNFDNHNYFIYITKDGVEKKSAQTIGEILGGEWVEGSDVKGTIAIGLITDSALDAFSFEVK